MNGHNSIEIIGNIVADPKQKEYGGGKTLAEVNIAVNNNASKNKTTQYFKGTAFAGLGDVFTKYAKKGTSVRVSARIQVRQYEDKNGSKRQAAELVINDLLLLGDGSNAGVNNASLIGNLVKDPEITTLANGTSKAKFRLAINNARRKQDPAEYIDVVMFDKQADAAGKILTKGKAVHVIGRLEARSYERKDGTKGDSVEIVAERFQILGSKNGSKASEKTVTANAVEDFEEVPF